MYKCFIEGRELHSVIVECLLPLYVSYNVSFKKVFSLSVHR